MPVESMSIGDSVVDSAGTAPVDTVPIVFHMGVSGSAGGGAAGFGYRRGDAEEASRLTLLWVALIF